MVSNFNDKNSNESKINEVNYDNVVDAARFFLKKGQRFNIEKIRKYLGTNDTVAIASYLKEWQGKMKKKPVAKKVFHPKNNYNNEYIKDNKPKEFNLDTFLNQPKVVQSLFIATFLLKIEKNNIVEYFQNQNSINLLNKINSDKHILDLNIQIRNDVKKLFRKINDIHSNFNKEKDNIRNDLMKNCILD